MPPDQANGKGTTRLGQISTQANSAGARLSTTKFSLLQQALANPSPVSASSHAQTARTPKTLTLPHLQGRTRGTHHLAEAYARGT